MTTTKRDANILTAENEALEESNFLLLHKLL